jgi:cell wall-active antibiotic response 4TMS protein YvqF
VPGITLAGSLIVVGVLAFLSRITGWDLQARDFLGAALLVVGLGLIAAAFSGGRRARGGLIALGVLLSLGLVSTSTSWHWHGASAMGDRVYAPLTASDVRPNYSGGVGDMTVNLSGVDLDGASLPIRTRIEHGVGDIVVQVPESADVQVTVDNGLGDVNLFDGTDARNGLYAGTGSEPWAGDGNPEFVITIGSGVGDVEVSRG